MTAPSAVPRPLPSVISARAPFARITRKGRSPPPHLKAASAAPATTPSVPWAPTPAPPSHTAPPRAPSEWKRSQRQRRPWRLPSDSAAQLNTSFPVKCATVGLQASCGPKRRATKGNTVLYDQCCGPPHKEETHWPTPQCCLRHNQRVDRQSFPAPSALFLLIFFFPHETWPIMPCTAHLYPFGGTAAASPCCCFFLSFIKVGEIVSVVSHLHLPALWRNNKVKSTEQRRETERQGQCSPPPPPPSHSLFTCCKMSLAHRKALSLHSQDGL